MTSTPANKSHWLVRLWRNRKFRIALWIGVVSAISASLPNLQTVVNESTYAALVIVADVLKAIVTVINLFIGGVPL